MISSRDEDIEVGKHICSKNGLELTQITQAEPLHEFLIKNMPATVLWDADIKDPNDAVEKANFNKIGQTLVDHRVPPDRVFGIRNKNDDQTPFVFNSPSYSSLILRQFNPIAKNIFSMLAKCAVTNDPFGIEKYLPEGTVLQKIVIKNSDHRGPATEAVNNVLLKRGFNSRLSSSIAKAVDEMLMNAIFDAPIDAKNTRYRNSQLRTDVFDLKNREEVFLEIGTTDNYGIISVSDQFGSLERRLVLNRLQKDYQNMDYEVNEKIVGAGVGLYGILHSGLSLHFASKLGFKTEVFLFFPIVKNIKLLRNSFRFVSFFSPKNS